MGIHPHAPHSPTQHTMLLLSQAPLTHTPSPGPPPPKRAEGRGAPPRTPQKRGVREGPPPPPGGGEGVRHRKKVGDLPQGEGGGCAPPSRSPYGPRERGRKRPTVPDSCPPTAGRSNHSAVRGEHTPRPIAVKKSPSTRPPCGLDKRGGRDTAPHQSVQPRGGYMGAPLDSPSSMPRGGEGGRNNPPPSPPHRHPSLQRGGPPQEAVRGGANEARSPISPPNWVSWCTGPPSPPGGRKGGIPLPPRGRGGVLRWSGRSRGWAGQGRHRGGQSPPFLPLSAH